MESLKFILKLLKWAIVLAYAGQLVDETLFYKAKAIESHRKGLMRLGDWSRKLERPSHFISTRRHPRIFPTGRS